MTFSKEIIEILEYIGDKFGIAIDWSSENVMPYLQALCEKYIAWEVSTSTAWLIGATVVLLLMIMLMYIVVTKSEDPSDIVIGGILFVTIGIIALIAIGIQIYDIITCNTFPELKIINFLQQQIAMIK